MIKTKSFFLLVSILLAGKFGLYAQNFLQPSVVQGEPIGVKQGLSQGMINCIYQDKEGYMWICTKDGLNKYDGYKIFTFRNDPNDPYSLPDNYCTAAGEDEKGNFWIGTNTKGLFLFDKTKEKFYPVNAINSNKENLCIRELFCNNGKLFLKTWNDALILNVGEASVKTGMVKTNVLFSYNRWQPNGRYQMNRNTFDKFYSSWMPDNSIWISFTDSIFHLKPANDFSACTIDAYTAKEMGVDKNNMPVVFFSAIPDKPHMLLIAFKNILAHFNLVNKKIEYQKILPVSHKENVKKIIGVSNGDICIFTDTTLYLYNPKSGTTKTISSKISGWPKGAAFDFFIDANGIQWLGSAGFGIVKKDPRNQLFKSYLAFKIDDIFRNLPSHFLPTLTKQLRGRFGLTDIVLDNKSTYWIKVYGNTNPSSTRLASHNTQSGELRYYSLLPEDMTGESCLYNDPSDRLWMYYKDKVKKNHIARISKESGKVLASYEIPNDIDLPELYVSQFILDTKNILWFTTINGLYAFDEQLKKWKHWKNIPGNNNSLSSDKLLSICADPISPDKYLWIGTEGVGFNRFDKETGNCLRFTENDGLPNNVAYCILSDSLHNLWISTNKGLSCFSPAKKTFRNFTEEDGLPGNEFNRYTAMKMQNGELMFGGVDGFVIFNPKAVLQKQPAAPIVFTGVSISNKPVKWQTGEANLTSPVGYAKTLTLKPGENIFSISFATLEFRSNAKKMYKYRLIGFDKEWTNPGSKNEVTYTNLSPGNYTFSVMGANTDGVWNETPISMKIIVQPYWYQTLLFKVCMLLMIGFVIFAFIRYRLNQRLKLEKLRNRIARDLHDEIGSTLSSISIYAESAKLVSNGNKKTETILTKINTDASEMMEAMSDIVWAVNTGNDRLEALANRIRAYAVQLTESKNIDLEFTDNNDIPVLVLDMEQRKNIYLICKEAISNAVKYSSCTLIQVKISKEQNRLLIQIQDNGTGFEINNPEKNKPGNSFGGNGLRNMNTRANEMNATIEISSVVGLGTRIMLSVNLKNHYN